MPSRIWAIDWPGMAMCCSTCRGRGDGRKMRGLVINLRCQSRAGTMARSRLFC
jgi:hypothetical protein